MSCPITLAGIAKDCKGIGGVKNIWLADRSLVDDVTITANEIDDIEPAALFAGKKYSTRKQVAVMESVWNVDEEAGTAFVETTLQAAFAKMDKTKRLEINALAIGDVVALVEDNNGNFWYLGLEHPVTLQEGGGSTGQAFGDANQYTITLVDQASVLPYPVTSAAALAATTAPE